MVCHSKGTNKTWTLERRYNYSPPTNCGKVMFHSCVSVDRGLSVDRGSHTAITHDALDLIVQALLIPGPPSPDMEPHWTGTHSDPRLDMEPHWKIHVILLFFLQDMCFDCHLAGKGGICDVDVPLNRWGDRMWFRMALSVIALSDRFIKRLLPGVHSGEQNFSDNYTGM